MITFFVLDAAHGESHSDFAKRVNEALDMYRDANLVVNYTPLPGGTLTIYAQVGGNEPVMNGGQLVGMKFTDMPAAEVEKKLDARKAALARGPSRVLRPE